MRFKSIIGRYRRAHREGRQHIRRRPQLIPIVVFGFAVLAAVAISVVLLSRGGDNLRPSGAHVVFLFDSGKRQTLDTKANTVGELLSKLDIKLIPQDVVEPSLSEPIPEDNFRINIYRARPVVVIDNSGSKVVTLTAQKSARVVAQNAGVTVYPEDIARFEQGHLKENIIGEKVVIDRSIPVQLNLYGNVLNVRTQAKTVAELLREKQIKPVA